MKDEQLFEESRVLIIADDTDTAADLADLLLLPHTQFRFSDHQQAIAIYNAWSPDLIMLDLRLRLDWGLVLVDQLDRLSRGHIPILALTALASPLSHQVLLKAGAKDFLALPCDAVEAFVRVRNLLEMRHLHQRIYPAHGVMNAPTRRRDDEPHRTQRELFRRLGHLVARRDRTTGTHVMRMSRYAAVLGRAAGLTEAESEMLKQASPMHDIGKIGIPDRILLKPTALEPDERAVMQTHTTIGAELLAGDNSPDAHDAA